MADILALTCITLTADPDLRAKLARKLAEYKTRMQYRAPETDPHQWYKLRVLGRLLEKGSVNVTETEAEFRRYDWFDEDTFRDAVSIVDAYNRNDTARLRGGTGLK